MDSWKSVSAAARRARWFVALILAWSVTAGPAGAQPPERLRVAVGRAAVVTTTDDIRTVVISEPKIADAAVGSERTVVVNGKTPGLTTLVVYTPGRYRVYDVEVYTPNAWRQVALHVRVAEVNDNAKRELGFDWFGQGANTGRDYFVQGGLYTTKVSNPEVPLIGPDLGARTDGFLNYQRPAHNWLAQTKWRALEEKGDLRTLANPTLVARSGEQASFLAGGEIPIPVASSAQAGVSTISIEWKEFGVRLHFTPTIEEDESISLKVAPEVSQLDFSNALMLSGFAIPALISRKASTTISLRAGEHLVIGGLQQEEKSKTVRRVPVIGHVPVLGFFFTHSRNERTTSELLVVVSPEILAGASPTLPELPTDRPEGK